MLDIIVTGLLTMPWLIVIYISLFGGKISYESKGAMGLPKQIKELIEVMRHKPDPPTTGNQKPETF